MLKTHSLLQPINLSSINENNHIITAFVSTHLTHNNFSFCLMTLAPKIPLLMLCNVMKRQKRRDKWNLPTVEGDGRRTRHRHATTTPIKVQVVGNGDVTKIELELEEAPDGIEDRLPAIIVGSVSSELDSTIEINSTYPGYPRPGSVVVRAEEALIVIFVLLLWVAAIALFFNRWGKIRMLEPYQPKFQQQHRPSCSIVDPTPLPLRSCSKFNIHCSDHSQCQSITNRPRQNSVFVGSSMSYLSGNVPRRTKSAFDLQSLVLNEGIEQTDTDFYHQQDKELEIIEQDEVPPVKSLRSFADYPKPSRSFQRDRGMSISQFDRTDVLSRPLQRERGMSICHFDRMDVLAHPITPRDRGMSICQFDRMDVLARPTPQLFRSSRSSVFSNADKLETLGKSFYQRGSRSSIGNFEASARFLQQRIKDRTESLGRNVSQRVNNVNNMIDRPSCSKTPDVVLGYKATCV